MYQASTFAKEETGAVTVDWVVLTGALVGLGLAVSGVISQGLQAQSEAIDAQLTDQPIPTTFAEFASNRSFSYTPHNQDLFDDLVTELAGYSDEDLIIVNAAMNYGIDEAFTIAEADGLTVSQADLNEVEDIYGSLDTAFHERGLVRDVDAKYYDQAQIDQIRQRNSTGMYAFLPDPLPN